MSHFLDKTETPSPQLLASCCVLSYCRNCGKVVSILCTSYCSAPCVRCRLFMHLQKWS